MHICIICPKERTCPAEIQGKHIPHCRQVNWKQQHHNQELMNTLIRILCTEQHIKKTGRKLRTRNQK